MSMAVVYSAPLVAVGEDIEPGDALLFDDAERAYMLSTAAARAAKSGRRSTGIAQTAGNRRTGVIMLVTGPVPASLAPELGAGAEGWVRVSALGRLERIAIPSAADDVMGWVDASGRVTSLTPAVDAIRLATSDASAIRGRAITTATPLNGQAAAVWNAALNTHQPAWPAMPGEVGDAISFGAVPYTSLAAARAGIGSGMAFYNLFQAMGSLLDGSRGQRTYVPKGYFRIEKGVLPNDTLSISRSGHIMGFGTGGRFPSSVLVLDDGVKVVFESQADSPDGGRCDFIRVEAIGFYGAQNARVTKISAGVTVRTSAHFEYCSFIGFHGRGCEVDGSIGAGYFANYGEFNHCWFEDNTRDGFYIHGGNGNSWQLNTCVSVSNGRPQPALRALQVAAAGPTFVDVTAAFNDATTGNLQPFPTAEAIGDYFAVCHTDPFQKLVVSYIAAGGAVPGVGGLVAWEYWNGTAWVAFPTINDLTAAASGSAGATLQPTASFTNTIPSRADKRVYWEEPIDWATTTLNGTTGYWARSRITQVYSTNPILDQGWVHDGAGYFDSSFLGCAYINPQTEANACAYKVTGPTNRANFTGPYAELDQGPCLLTQNTVVSGGALNGVGIGKQHGGAMVLTNSNTCTPLRVPNNNAAGTTTIFSTLGHNSTSMYAYTWGKVGDAGFYAMGYDLASFTWQLRSTAANFLAYSLTSEGNATGPGFLQFPSGFLMSGNRIITMGAAPPTGVSTRASGLWLAGDIMFNSMGSTTTELLWRCSVSGVVGTPAGTWVAHNF